jgi:hypothetical protein
MADNPMGEWKQYDNPCTGKDAETTFNSQSTFIVAIPGSKNAFVFLADRWNKTNLPDSRYLWLPMIMKEGKPEIQHKTRWNFSDIK